MSDNKKTDLPPLPSPVAQAIQAELDPDEVLLWTGQPLSGKYAGGGWRVVPFGAFFLTFAVFWTLGAAGVLSGDGLDGVFTWVFPLWGLPFIASGLWMVLSPWRFWRRSKKIGYAITSRRAIITYRRMFRASVRTIMPFQMTDLEMTASPDGTGCIYFSPSVSRPGAVRSGFYFGGPVLPSSAPENGFTAIAEVRTVAALLRRLAESSAAVGIEAVSVPPRPLFTADASGEDTAHG